jgi:replicative DNA helicase
MMIMIMINKEIYKNVHSVVVAEGNYILTNYNQHNLIIAKHRNGGVDRWVIAFRSSILCL